MGAWGTGPLDNDNAADWFGDLFEDTRFRDHVVAGLRSGHPDTIRAAAWLVARLAEVYVWPIETLDDDRILAGTELLRLQQDADWLEMWSDPDEALAELEEEVEALALSPDELARAKTSLGGTVSTKKATTKKATKKKVTKKKAAKKKVTKKKAAKKKAAKKKAPKKKVTKKKAAKKKAAKGWTRLEFVGPGSTKFWSIRVHGSSHTVHYGRKGTDGQQKTKAFDSAADAKAAAAKLIAQKRKKGYV